MRLLTTRHVIPRYTSTDRTRLDERSSEKHPCAREDSIEDEKGRRSERERERERERVRGDRGRGGEQKVEKAVPIEQAADERQSECSN